MTIKNQKRRDRSEINVHMYENREQNKEKIGMKCKSSRRCAGMYENNESDRVKREISEIKHFTPRVEYKSSTVQSNIQKPCQECENTILRGCWNPETIYLSKFGENARNQFK